MAAAESKTDLYRDSREVLEMLNEPILGITREERMDLIEGESFKNLLAAAGD